MWRTILLGKMSVSILASLVLGIACGSQPWRQTYSMGQAASWVGIGVFFLLLGLAQIVAVFFLFRKKRFRDQES